MGSYRRTFEGRLEQLPAIHEFVERSASELDLSEDDAFACRLVADEAATNVFEHAYANEPGKLEVVLSRDEADVVLSVRDWGAPFNPTAIPEPDIHRPLEERPVGGLGIFLMRRFMDDVSYSFHPVEGNTVTMRRKLQPTAGRERETVEDR